ncbi:hypothetical protein HK099_003890 [Clydaea vesicula]|uniref:Uncharacterized protein n=1 Tax=Clydaea vesicula TaxID=447962 RepID=A0AAD5U176_9FUNG|nr:hypothetical protein HK099_003890 [Clydaea vesicula]
MEWNISYSAYTQTDTENRIGKKFTDICNNARPITDLLNLNITMDKSYNIKEDVYKGLCMCIDIEDYPMGNIEPFKESNITDFAFITLAHIIKYYKDIENISSIKLRRENVITSKDGETGGKEEFIIIDCIEMKDRYILIIEAKTTSLINCLKQCILALKDCYDNNNDGKQVFGLLTTGIAWQIVIYTDEEINISEEIPSAFPLMSHDKDRWIKNYSMIVDCIYNILYISTKN